MSVFDTKAKAAMPDSASLAAGTHAAVLVAIVDLGTHSEEYKGVSKRQRELYFVWEIPAEQNALYGEVYNIGSDGLSSKSRLRIMLEGWRGKKYGPDEPINVLAGLGKSCILTITHKQSGEKSYPQLAGVSALVKGMTAPTPSRKPFSWEIGSAPLPDVDWLPWAFVEGSRMSVKEAVACSEEVKPRPVTPAPAPGPSPANGQRQAQQPATVGAAASGDDDIPF